MKRLPMAAFVYAVIISALCGLYLRSLGAITFGGGSVQLVLSKSAIEMIATIPYGVIAVFVILRAGYSDRDKHWAYATAGLLLGFWLHLEPR